MALRGNARLAVNIPYVMALPAVSRSPPVNHIRKQSHYDDDDEEEEDFFQHANKYQNLAKTKYDVTIAWETVGSFWLGSKAFLQTELIFHSAKLQFHLFCDGYGSNKVYAFCLTIRKSVNTIWGGSRLGKEETNGMVPSPPITVGCTTLGLAQFNSQYSLRIFRVGYYICTVHQGKYNCGLRP
uniref:Uncharacterized protein n=1 Tax=Aplanochytrium stocchinoi TaxID=215587 RepID=A0A7S3V1Z6_9STRA|mmetsp:Transcript_15008/g.17554  ORF Transcript_15008/g.17554 Transcript_15008/m.17554 type:complete len:183 (-) Transcript_15008:351-899(-)